MGYTLTTEEVRQLAPLTDEEFDRWVAEVKAEAWDEGYSKAWVDDCGYPAGLADPVNPYRGENK